MKRRESVNTFAKRSLMMLLAISFLVMLPFSGMSARIEMYEIVDEQLVDLTKYINALVLPNGALPMNAPSVSSFSSQGLETIDGVDPEVYLKWPSAKIVPYFSELALLGLLKTSPNDAKESTEKFVNWYISHLNDKTSDINGVDGTVYDYYCFVDPTDNDHIIEVTLRKLNEYKYLNKPSENPNDYDSTDSYAACFMRVLYEYYDNYGKDFLLDKKDSLLRIINALKSTYVPAIGLTGAKPNYMVCYLMDNCEVYDGLVAASKLFDEVYGDKELSKELLQLSETVKAAIEKHLWSEENSAYYPYVFADGVKPEKPDITVFYPDATAQLFTISFGLLDPASERAQKLYEDFNVNFGTTQKGWQFLTTGDSFPWASISIVAAKMQDYERLETYIRMIRGKFKFNDYAYPFYNSEAGSMLNMYDTFLNSDYYKETHLPKNDEVSGAESINESEPNEESIIDDGEQSKGIWKYLLIGGAVLAVASAVVAILKKKKK